MGKTIYEWAKEAEQEQNKESAKSKNDLYGNKSLWQEFLLTFSNQKSLLSSKKIERFITFLVFLTLSIIYISFNIRTMSAFDFIQILGIWLSYAGFNTFQLRKQQEDQNSTS